MTVPAVLAGAKMALSRLMRVRTVVTFVVAIVAVLVIAIIERAATSAGAADRTLAAVFRFIIPISVVVLSGTVTGSMNLRESAWPASRFGHPRSSVALGIVLTSAVAAIALAVVASLVALVAARAGVEPARAALPFASDLLTTGWIAILAGGAYAAFLGLGATFGKKGGGRLAFLLVDFFLGGAGTAGVILPRGGITHLIGGEAPFGLPQAASSAIVPAVAILCLALGSLRCRD
ncbi:MAG: hypothetical protein HOV80_12055 [Polyangiaceae bacterium]|nr:hypothetical protein [Polyangiaceae bacterium]